MNKKLSLCVLAASLLTTSVLAACGGKKTPSSSDTPAPSSSVPTTSIESSHPTGSVSSQSTGVPSQSSNAPQSISSSVAPSSSSSKPSSTSQIPTVFDFSIALDSGLTYLREGTTARLVVTPNGAEPGTTRRYSYTSGTRTVATITNDGVVTAVAEGTSVLTVREATSKKSKTLKITVTNADALDFANGGYNFASLAGSEAINKRTEVLGSLEKYAMEHHLTGITLFENGGYVKYAERVHLPTTNYISGYGFGLLSEGTLTAPMPAANESEEAHRMYLHTATSQDPGKINARNDSGSQVSDLEGYITSSFWGTRLNSTKDGYEWYPVLAKDTVTYNNNTTPFNRPIPIYDGQEVKPGDTDPNVLGQYYTWRIYVKTGNALKYRYQGRAWGDNVFDGRAVTKEDYEFAYRFILTGSHLFSRGTEMAGDETYGIVGAQKYNTVTKEASDITALNTWNEMKESGELGIKVGTDSVNGDYIQLTLVNPIDRFTAMYTLSSNLVSPMCEDFIRALGVKSADDPIRQGARNYGLTNDNNNVPSEHKNRIVDSVICVGPYMLEDWVTDQAIVFKKNDLWTNDPNRYNIAGIKMLIIDSSNSTTKIFDRFDHGDLDSAGVPSKYISTQVNQPRVYKTKGDATFKLNVNSCDQETWNYLFGEQGKINKGSSWTLKPWMANENFLNGLFYSINRKEFAENRGVQPSINYLSDAYLSDPENGVSYNDSQAHKDAIAGFQGTTSSGESDYGYSFDKAVACFKKAVSELAQQGAVTYGQSEPIKIHIRWMYQTDQEEYGNAIAKYFTDAFNDPRVCENQVSLAVEQDAVTNWQDVYNEYLMKGQFDLGFGAISGNTYNPLNFLEVLKSDNSSGFTLNWGTDTSKVSQKNPVAYDNKAWSFDALWTAADHGGIVSNGEVAKTVEKCYLNPPEENELYNGSEFSVDTKFINSSSARINLTRVQIYVYGRGGFDVMDPDKVTVEADGILRATINLSKALAKTINDAIAQANKLDDPNKPDLYNLTPFTLENYGKYWTVEVSYSLAIRIEGNTEFGAPAESYATADPNIEAVVEEN